MFLSVCWIRLSCLPCLWLPNTWPWIGLTVVITFSLLVLRYNVSFFLLLILAWECCCVLSFLTLLVVGKPMVCKTFKHVCDVYGGVSRGRAFKRFLSGWWLFCKYKSVWANDYWPNDVVNHMLCSFFWIILAFLPLALLLLGKYVLWEMRPQLLQFVSLFQSSWFWQRRWYWMPRYLQGFILVMKLFN